MTEQLRKNIEDAEMHFFMQADPDIIKQYLDECDIEGKNLTKKEVLLKRIKFLSKASVKKQHDSNLLAIAIKYKEAIEKNTSKPLQYLRNIMASKVSASYNNSLDKLSQEEIIELIKDQNLINLMDQLEQNGIDNEAKI